MDINGREGDCYLEGPLIDYILFLLVDLLIFIYFFLILKFT